MRRDRKDQPDLAHVGREADPATHGCARGTRRPTLHPGAGVANAFMEIVLGPGEELDLRDELGPHPVHAADRERDPKRASRVGGMGKFASWPPPYFLRPTGNTALNGKLTIIAGSLTIFASGVFREYRLMVRGIRQIVDKFAGCE